MRLTKPIWHLKKRSIQTGDMLYGERLQLEDIIRNESEDEIVCARKILECLHGRTFSDRQVVRLMPYALECADAFVKWLERERNECSNPPDAEMLAAGVDKFSEEVGRMAQVVQLAKEMQCTFEDVYKMPYLDIFVRMKVEAAEARFEKRLHKVIEQKTKHG